MRARYDWRYEGWSVAPDGVRFCRRNPAGNDSDAKGDEFTLDDYADNLSEYAGAPPPPPPPPVTWSYGSEWLWDKLGELRCTRWHEDDASICEDFTFDEYIDNPSEYAGAPPPPPPPIEQVDRTPPPPPPSTVAWIYLAEWLCDDINGELRCTRRRKDNASICEDFSLDDYIDNQSEYAGAPPPPPPIAQSVDNPEELDTAPAPPASLPPHSSNTLDTPTDLPEDDYSVENDSVIGEEDQKQTTSIRKKAD